MIKRERRGDYLGKTVQIVPHVTDMIQNWIKEVSKISVDGSGATPDLCLVEVRWIFCCSLLTFFIHSFRYRWEELSGISNPWSF